MMKKEIKIYYCQECLDTLDGKITPVCDCDTDINVYVDDDITGFHQFMGTLTGNTIVETLEIIKNSPWNHCNIQFELGGYLPDITVEECERQ